MTYYVSSGMLNPNHSLTTGGFVSHLTVIIEQCMKVCRKLQVS